MLLNNQQNNEKDINAFTSLCSIYPNKEGIPIINKNPRLSCTV